jgi:SOS-response transcriptional repressor LexA
MESIQNAPQWATHICALRERLRFSQTQLGMRLSCSSMTISRWERGLVEPSANHYIQLGNLAGKTECWFYWRRAGLSSSNLLRLLPGNRPQKARSSSFPELDAVVAGSGGKLPKTKLVAIPVLQVHAGTHGEVGDDVTSLDEAKADDIIAAPAEWCPNPEHTKCLRVKGNSMMPLIHDGHIVAVDCSQTDISELDGKLVIAWNEQKGLCISRFRHYGDVSVLEPENRQYESVVLGASRHGWRIVAKVLWWIGKAP